MVYYVNCPRTGTLEDADFLEFLNDDPDVTRKVYFVHAGQEVKGFDTGVPMWIGMFRNNWRGGNLTNIAGLVLAAVLCLSIGLRMTSAAANAHYQSARKNTSINPHFGFSTAEIAMEGPVGDLQRLTKKMEKVWCMSLNVRAQWSVRVRWLNAFISSIIAALFPEAQAGRRLSHVTDGIHSSAGH